MSEYANAKIYGKLLAKSTTKKPTYRPIYVDILREKYTDLIYKGIQRKNSPQILRSFH